MRLVKACVSVNAMAELMVYEKRTCTTCRKLAELLRERGIDQLTVVGLATDYCVKQTALEALQEGFAVTVDTTAVRGVDVEAGDADRALSELRTAGAVLA